MTGTKKKQKVLFQKNIDTPPNLGSGSVVQIYNGIFILIPSPVN